MENEQNRGSTRHLQHLCADTRAHHSQRRLYRVFMYESIHCIGSVCAVLWSKLTSHLGFGTMPTLFCA